MRQQKNNIANLFHIPLSESRENAKTKIALPAFLFQLESKRFSKDFSKHSVPEGLVDEVKNFLKDNYPGLVKKSFGDLEERENLGEVISQYISSKKVLEEHKSSLGGLTHHQLVNSIVEKIAGFGVIDQLFSIPTLTDIHINGPDSIWIDDYMYGPQKTKLKFKGDKEYSEFLSKLMNASDMSYSLAKPYVSGSLPRLRYDIIGFDLAPYPTCSIRIISKKLRISEDTFIQTGQGSKGMLDFIKELMRSDVSLLVSGSTGAGKTELMRFLGGYIPNEKRIITMEDTKELYLESLYKEKNIVSWNTRFEFTEQKNRIDLSRLVKAALRHHPKWLIVGETRGGELYQLLEAAQTGHNVLTGIHSHEGESVQRMITILQSYLPSEEDLYGRKIVDNLPINLHVERIDKQRIITRISEYVSFSQGEVVEKILIQYNRQTKQHEQIGDFSPKLWKKITRDPQVDKDKLLFVAPNNVQLSRSAVV